MLRVIGPLNLPQIRLGEKHQRTERSLFRKGSWGGLNMWKHKCVQQILDGKTTSESPETTIHHIFYGFMVRTLRIKIGLMFCQKPPCRVRYGIKWFNWKSKVNCKKEGPREQPRHSWPLLIYFEWIRSNNSFSVKAREEKMLSNSFILPILQSVFVRSAYITC